MNHVRSNPQLLPTKFATAAVETNQLTDAESCDTQFVANLVTVFTANALKSQRLSLSHT